MWQGILQLSRFACAGKEIVQNFNARSFINIMCAIIFSRSLQIEVMSREETHSISTKEPNTASFYNDCHCFYDCLIKRER